MCAKRTWFFVAVGCYLVLLLAVACYARRNAPTLTRAERDQGGALRQHFMAVGNFGVGVMALTLFATAFSGSVPPLSFRRAGGPGGVH